MYTKQNILSFCSIIFNFLFCTFFGQPQKRYSLFGFAAIVEGVYPESRFLCYLKSWRKGDSKILMKNDNSKFRTALIASLPESVNHFARRSWELTVELNYEPMWFEVCVGETYSKMAQGWISFSIWWWLHRSAHLTVSMTECKHGFTDK